MTVNPAGSRHETHEVADLMGVRKPPADMNDLPAIVWPKTTDRNADGVVTIGGVAVTDLVAEYGTPLFVLDEEDFRTRVATMAESFGGAHNVHYAAKAFLCGEVARWINEAGLCMDVASGYEMGVALAAGFPASRMTLHGNNKSVAELRRAVEIGVEHVVVDSLYEIDRLNAVAGELGKRQNVFVRVTCGVEAHTHDFIATAHEDQKFGFSLVSGQAAEAVRRVIEADNLILNGLHSHIGSQIFDVAGFDMAAHRIIKFFAAIVDEYGPEATEGFSIVDLGGGFGIAYLESDDPPAIPEIAADLRAIVEKEAAAAGIPTPQLMVEPGRSIAGPSMVTLYTVGTLKDVVLPSGVTRHYVAVDGGMSDNIRTALYDAEYDCRLINRITDAEPALCRVVGKHCESGDVVVRDTWQPADVHPDDILGVAATGAYCYAMASRYNMLTRPAVVAVRDGKARLILRRETLDDLLSLEVS
ncbi:diaminopimelate decarboxylase [Lawsonella clevelandensis]|nr:diaminopimelate decarboxylase [Lawsonella clevelandensis]MDU7193501.1 diaminopimelate decarboxylase [Lawsonella clevelandensis]